MIEDQLSKFMQKNSSISGVLVVKNEQDTIENSLRSIVWADEIIVVDSSSTDLTINIASKYTSKVYHYDFNNDFSQIRNFALSKVTKDWIISLDADERLSTNYDLITSLTTSRQFDGFWFPRRNYIDEETYLKYGIFYPDYQLRLFRNKKNIKYKGKIHEKVNIEVKRTKKINEVIIDHTPAHTKYDRLYSFRRFFPYIKIESKIISESNLSYLELFRRLFTSLPKWNWRSIFKLRGYLDGYRGLRASFIFSLYRFTVYLVAIYTRLISNDSN